MKKVIAGLLAGLVLGTASTAVATTSVYWKRGGSDYMCEGISQGVTCNAGGFTVGVTQSYLFIKKRGSVNAPTFACEKWKRWSTCFGDTP